MLSLLDNIEKAKLLEQYVYQKFGDVKILEVDPSDAVRDGPIMMLFGDTEDWAQIMASGDEHLPLDLWIKRFERPESFWRRIVAYADKFDLTDSQLYNKAHVTRSVFSDLRNGKNPSRNTAIKLCLALKLDLKQTIDLLKLAGYTLSRSRKDDLVIMYCILENNHSLLSINEHLAEFECCMIDW